MRSIDIANKNAVKPKVFGFHKSKKNQVNLSPRFIYNYSKKEMEYIKANGGLLTNPKTKQ